MFFESVKIMFLGMGTVFLFLIVMVLLTKMMSKIIQKYFPESIKIVEPLHPVHRPVASNDAKAKVAAVVAAMYHHQSMNAEIK